jgi:hypothetical protein
MGDRDEDPFGHGETGQIVQQPQAGFVRVVSVVDQEHGPVSRRSEAQELRDADEQPLVPALTRPLLGRPAQRLGDLDAVVVGKTVQERRMPSAQVRQRL